MLPKGISPSRRKRMLEIVKLALRIVTDDFDEEIQLLIDDCISEMEHLGVTVFEQGEDDPQIVSAIIAYCKWRFGDADNKTEWEKIYHTKLGQFQMMSLYTEFDG